jgi:hypothetical protein
MKKLLVLFFMLCSAILTGQESVPIGANFKSLPTVSFKWYTTDNTVWMYKGATYGWTNLTKYANYRRLNDHDSLSTLQEKSYNSLNDLPNLDLKANVDDPTFTTKITTPYLNIPTGAALNYFWQCTDATTGAGQWAAVTASQVYKGTWNATTNTPTLADGTGTAGWYYRCTTAGTVNLGSGNIAFSVGDDAYYNGTVWQRVPAGASQWVTTGSDIYYNKGKIAVGTTSASGRVTINADDGYELTFAGSAGANINSPSQDVWFYTGTGKTLRFGSNNVNDVLVLDASNNVELLYDHKIWSKTSTSTGYNAGITLFDGSGNMTLANNFGLSESAGRIDFQTSSTNNTPVTRMTILKSGYIGVGKTPTTLFDVNGEITATGGNSTQWNTAYTHSQIAGGNSVHVSNTENTQWDAAYTHSQVAGGNSVHVSTDENTAWDAAYNHSLDATQAHSDYLINNDNDATSGTLTAVNFILSSDERLKENIKPIQNLSNVRNVQLVQFNMKDDPNQLRYGSIAQQVEKFIPELVRTDDEGMKSVAYIDLLVMKIADLEQRVLELEKKNKRLIRKNK